MTEADWLSATDVEPLLRWAVPRGTRRQLRLYLCGGCRAVSRSFWQPESLEAVEVAERYVDGLATRDEFSRINWWAEAPGFDWNFDEAFWRGLEPSAERDDGLRQLVVYGALPTDFVWGNEWRIDPLARDRLVAAANLAFYAVWRYPQEDWADWSQGFVEQCSRRFGLVDWPGRWLVDCLYGNPFRPPVVAPAWRTPTVLAVAAGIYDGRAFDRLPVLADALEDAGCDAADLLAHLRGPGPHARGCWVLDRVLGKPDEPSTERPG